jgi:hypothetical protein
MDASPVYWRAGSGAFSIEFCRQPDQACKEEHDRRQSVDDEAGEPVHDTLRCCRMNVAGKPSGIEAES